MPVSCLEFISTFFATRTQDNNCFEWPISIAIFSPWFVKYSQMPFTVLILFSYTARQVSLNAYYGCYYIIVGSRNSGTPQHWCGCSGYRLTGYRSWGCWLSAMTSSYGGKHHFDSGPQMMMVMMMKMMCLSDVVQFN